MANKQLILGRYVDQFLYVLGPFNLIFVTRAYFLIEALKIKVIA